MMRPQIVIEHLQTMFNEKQLNDLVVCFHNKKGPDEPGLFRNLMGRYLALARSS